ncbi:ornithine cyclodeaminase family protein [Limisalsivibrio acetivorans]|uniref:ornithine cyclodeaminase family protein n=1 Tax=Limisalsivibrio acetivorans TaxID=1304888 RepID=UPI0003B70FCF|nr:ornithine cyclodeaminase family protein [Limisalsivibrio acetivorans]
MAAIYLSEEDVKSVLDINKTVDLVEESFKTYSLGESFNMERRRMRIRKGALHMLPAAVPYKGVLGYKAYTSFRTGLIFKVHLYCAETGTPLAIVEASELGRLRTGSASGVATKHMANKDSKIGSIFGAGYQGEAHIKAVAAANKFEKIYVVDLKEENAKKFAEKVSKEIGVEMVPETDAEKVVKESDIITTATWSVKPLFKHEWIEKKGVHINATGSNALIRAEVPEKTVEKADKLAVDAKDVAEVECGDILPSLEKGRLHWNEILELGDVVSGIRSGRDSEDELTVFESQGMGLQDVMVAEYVYRIALENKLGKELPF